MPAPGGPTAPFPISRLRPARFDIARGGFPRVRDAELFRRPPFLVGDEAAVLRYTRTFRKRRRLLQLGFIGGVMALAAVLTVLKIPDILVGGGAFAALSTAFVAAHL